MRQWRPVVVGQCLKDAGTSPSVAGRWNLIYALVTKSNVKTLAKELLTYLALGPRRHGVQGGSDREDLCGRGQVSLRARQWQIETIIQVLATAGSLTQENVSTDLILLISRSTALHAARLRCV